MAGRKKNRAKQPAKKAAAKPVKPTPKKSSPDKTKSASKKKLPSKKSEPVKGRKPGFASNNFNYIRALIWREYGLDYQSYFDPELLRISKEVYQKCKQFSVDNNGSNCSDKDILAIFDDVVEEERELGRRPYPEIEENLFSPMEYYELTNVKFETMPSYLYVSSSMIIPDPSIFNVTQYYDRDGDMSKGYKKYFKEFINWANAVSRSKSGGEVDSEDIEIFVRFIKPEYDEEKKRWVTEIIICTSTGERFSFGFVPRGSMGEHDDPDDEFIEAPDKGRDEEIKLTPEQIEERKKNDKKLFSTLLKLTRKYEQLEKLAKAAKASKKAKPAKSAAQVKKETAQQRDKQNSKAKELKRLQVIKKELQSAVSLYKRIGDKKRMNKALTDLDAVMNKIRKLS